MASNYSASVSHSSAPQARPVGRATRDDVAALAGVSSATVSYVINNGPRPVSAGTRERVHAAIRQLGYTPDAIARSLRTQHTAVLGLVIPDSANLFFAELARHIERVAEDRGYHILLCNSGEDLARERAHLEALRQQRVAGIILIATDSVDSKVDRGLEGLPMVALDRTPLGWRGAVVRTDPEAGGAVAVEHLLSLGHHRIAFAHGPLHLAHAQRRLEGGIALLTKRALPVCDYWKAETSFDFEGGWSAAERLMTAADPPTAICCSNDAIAIGVLAWLHVHHLAVPELVSVTGFDDVPLARFAAPPLTTVAQPYAGMARLALDALLTPAGEIPGATSNPVEHVLPVHLVERSSTGRAHTHRSDLGALTVAQ
ncbi:MAG: LacI family transcriptional regulator [Chloroflexi bacterium]|nr:LacI family transcriptional regulator [Chloroflexota bacterium]